MRQLPGLFPATDGEWTMLFKWRSPDGLHTATHWALLHQVSDLIEIWFTTSRDRVAIQLVGAPIWLGGVPGHIGADGCAIIPRLALVSEHWPHWPPITRGLKSLRGDFNASGCPSLPVLPVELAVGRIDNAWHPLFLPLGLLLSL